MNMYRKRHKEKVIYKYDCTITGKSYKRTEKAANPEELMSIDAYYQLHAEKDDRPAVVKKKLGVGTTPTVTETPTN
jgi:hypothetical protein